RHDYLVNLAQTVIETLLFYHPAVWWLSNQVRRERENCCDDVAIAMCGDRRAYARALYLLEQQRQTAPALAATGGSLVERVRRLAVSPGASQAAPRTTWLAGAIALVAIGLVVWFAPSRVVAEGANEPAGSIVDRALERSAGEEGTPNTAQAGETPAPE